MSELGRPLIPDSIENFAEGVVIKPLKEIMVKNAKGSDIRAIVKKKIKEFAEVSIVALFFVYHLSNDIEFLGFPI